MLKTAFQKLVISSSKHSTLNQKLILNLCQVNYKIPKRKALIIWLDSPEKALKVGVSAVMQGICTVDTLFEKHFQVLICILK